MILARQLRDFLKIPNLIRNSSGHRRGYSQSLVHPSKVIAHGVNRYP
jgi:hypothetical protein